MAKYTVDEYGQMIPEEERMIAHQPSDEPAIESSSNLKGGAILAPDFLEDAVADICSNLPENESLDEVLRKKREQLKQKLLDSNCGELQSDSPSSDRTAANIESDHKSHITIPGPKRGILGPDEAYYPQQNLSKQQLKEKRELLKRKLLGHDGIVSPNVDNNDSGYTITIPKAGGMRSSSNKDT